MDTQTKKLRNRLSHGYDSVDEATIWVIVCKYLPILKKEVTALLDENMK